MRLAIIGYGAESSTFSRHRMTLTDFDVKSGAELLALYDVDAWFAGADDLEWLPVVRAHGGAGGPVVPEAYAAIADEILAGLTALVAAGPVDGVYVDLHGASHVDGADHAEERLLARVREVVGEHVVISMSMDTHGNFSRELAELVDLAVCFRHAPHIDAWAIRRRAMEQLVATIRRGARPHKAWVRVPVLLPGERTSTVVEPAKSAFGAIEPLIEEFGVVDASLWVGFAWADEDRNGGAVLVTGYDADAVVACAERVARLYWEPREGFVVVAEASGDWDGALDLALERPETPFFISDSGDNVTAGGTGDATFALERTLERTDVRDAGLRLLFASITDAPSVDASVEAGVGATMRRGIGAILDDRFGAPVEREWIVEQLLEGLYDDEGVVGAVLRAGDPDGGISVIVKRSRTAFYDPSVSSGRHGRRLPGHVWVPLDGYDAVVVKNGYLFPDQAAIAKTWYMALTPGGTDLDHERLTFERVERPMYPLDTDFEADLTPTLLPHRP
jgi:microcystin degradation protein MlrC